VATVPTTDAGSLRALATAHALRSGCAAVIALIIGERLHLPYTNLAVWTTHMVMNQVVFTSFQKGVERVLGRGFGIFGIDVDSRDFRTRSPGTVLRNVMSQLEHEKKGILLFHDIQPSTAGALASMLAELKARGYKVVHMVAKTPATTLPEYDAIAEKALKAKTSVAASDPLATRAATWPASGDGDSADPAAELAGPRSDAAPGPDDDLNLERMERHFIDQALRRCGQNVTQAARVLGVSRDTLRYRLDRLGLRDPGAPE